MQLNVREGPFEVPKIGLRLLLDHASQRLRYLVRVHEIARRLVDKHGPNRALVLTTSAAARASGKRAVILKGIAESAYDLNRLDIYYH